MARRVLLKTPANSVSGYGNDGIGLALAFDRAGWDVHLQPTTLAVPIPQALANLLTKAPDPPWDLFINHIDPTQVGLTDGERRSSRCAIAWTMWEWLDYHAKGHKSRFRRQISNFDALVCYDPVTVQALGSHTPKHVPILQQQGGIDPDGWPYADRDWSDTFRFCMVGQLGPRKNPFAAIETFQMLRDDGQLKNAELHAKTNIMQFHPAMEQAIPGFKIHYEYWTQKQMLSFYYAMHCLLAPSIGEGKNLPCLEAQCTGIPTIATAFGGHTVWQGDWSWNIGYSIEQLWGARAAEINRKELADAMVEAYEDRDKTRERGLQASKVIPAMCSWDKVVLDLTRKLTDAGLLT